METTKSLGVRIAPILVVAAWSGLLIGCESWDGTCPEISGVTPAAAGAAEEIVVEGSNFSVGHEDLFGDDSRAVPPEVLLRFDPELNPMMPADMQDMEMDLPADQVSFRASTELQVVTPDIDWNEIASGLELMGTEIELPSILTELPMGMRVVVRNAGECEAQWGEAFTLTIAVDQGSEEEVAP